MRKMQIRLAAASATVMLSLSFTGCGSGKWSIAGRSLRMADASAHPHLVTSPLAIDPAWEYGRSGPLIADQRQTPDYPPFNAAVISTYERLGISSGRPRDHVHWTTRARHGLSRR